MKSEPDLAAVARDAANVRRARRIVIAGVALLTLAIIGPLLRPGILLLLDWVPGPRPKLSPQFWGFPPGPPSRAPIEAITWAIDHIAPWGFAKMLPLASAPALAAWGFWRLFRPSPVVVLGATFFLIVNPFMYDRMLAGHLYLVDGFALMPLLLSYLLEGPSLRPAIKAGLVVATQIALSVHFVFITGVVLIAYAIAALAMRERRRALSSFASLGAAAAISVYWIIPALFIRTQSLGLSNAHLEAFRTRPDGRFGLLPNVLGLYGFWRSEWPYPKSHFTMWILLLGVMLLVVLVGFRGLVRTPKYRLAAITLAIASLVGALLALGDQGPTGSVFAWVFGHVPGFAAMREAQKFLGLLVVGYATAFAWGVRALAEQARTSRAVFGVVVVLLLLPTVYGFRELAGFVGWARPTAFPKSWEEADRLMGDGLGKVLSLPWHQYSQIPWAQGRVLSDPAGAYFRRDVIISNDPEVPGIQSVDPDAVHRYLDFVIRLKQHDTFGRLIAPLGVEYVLLAKQTDYETYAWLGEKPGLRKVREWRDLVLYENVELADDQPFVPSQRVALRNWGEVAGSAANAQIAELGINVDRAAPGPLKHQKLPATRDSERVRVHRSSPVAYSILESVADGPLVSSVTPAEGWHYGGTDSRANLGVTATFPIEEVSRGTIQYTPWRTVRLSYALGGMVLVAISALLLVRQ